RLVVNGYRRLGKSDTAADLIAAFGKAHPSSAPIDSVVEPDPRRPHRISAAEGMSESLFAASQLLLQSVNTSFCMQLAVVYGQGALYLNPDLTIARRILSATLADRERYTEANAILSSIAKSDPGYPVAQMQMAENYERMERPDDALAVLQDVAKERPTW